MKKSNFVHESVLLNETISNLNINPDGIYVDCTLGGGGHAKEILKKLKKGKLIAFDKDKDAISHCQKSLIKYKDKLEIINDNFVNLQKYIKNPVDGIILDAGVSSHQINLSKRGFSFQNDGPLDMRMNQDQNLNAHFIVNNYSYEKLIEILFTFGEEKYAKKIAASIIFNRKISPINSTLDLVNVIKNATPKKYHLKKHPARKTFQALRIATNNELVDLQEFVSCAPYLLKENGYLSIITFHSLEDKIVKLFFNSLVKPKKTPKEIPFFDKEQTNFCLLFKKPITPSLNEKNKNPRSRSAKLRILLKKGRKYE